ncbi:MAG: enoyl-CoA hydratase/isomerase family protein [Bryobacterales bacterium]|nr:enoyl-CoA hydratase/isomerase family protein [Bryobacterales bacterium]
MPEPLPDITATPQPTLLQTREGRVLHLVLNVPETRNQLSFAMCRELVAALQDAERDRSLGAVLLKGAGAAFCTGMDPQELLRDGAVEMGWIHEELFTLGAKLTTPVVCQVHGTAQGAGVGLLCNAHVVIAAQGTTFGLTEVRMGNWPFMTFRSLAATVGERRATELALTGRIFGTNEALQYNLIHAVTPPFELEDRAESTARMLADSSPELVRRGLDFIARTRGMAWGEAGSLAQQIRTEWFRHEDFAEGINAVTEQRKAEWPSLRAGNGKAPS